MEITPIYNKFYLQLFFSSRHGSYHVHHHHCRRRYPWVNLRVQESGGPCPFLPPAFANQLFFHLPPTTSARLYYIECYVTTGEEGIRYATRISQYLCRYVCFGLITFCGSSRERETRECNFMHYSYAHLQRTYN